LKTQHILGSWRASSIRNLLQRRVMAIHCLLDLLLRQAKNNAVSYKRHSSGSPEGGRSLFLKTMTDERNHNV